MAGCTIEPIGGIRHGSRGQNRCAVFHRDSDHLGCSAVRDLDLVPQRTHEQVMRRTAFCAGCPAKQGRCGVFDRCDDLAAGAVIPFIGDNAAGSKRGDGHERCMTRGRDRRKVVLARIEKDRALVQQGVQTASVSRSETSRIVIPELIHDNGHDQPRSGGHRFFCHRSWNCLCARDRSREQ